MIKVFQIADQEALHPACTFTYGMPVSSAFKPEEHMEKYEHVADLEATTLDEAFEVGNIGPEEKITRIAPMHSVSVGDVIRDDRGRCFVVSSIGFTRLGENEKEVA